MGFFQDFWREVRQREGPIETNLKWFMDRIVENMGSKSLGTSDLETIANQGNLLPDNEKPDKNQGQGCGQVSRDSPTSLSRMGRSCEISAPLHLILQNRKNDINHVIKIRLANTIKIILPAFNPIYKRVLGLFNNKMVVLNEYLETTSPKSQL
jgi:hypothetical protein